MDTHTEAPAEKATPKRELPTSKRVLWGMGGLADSMMYLGVNGLIDQIYIIALGYHAGLISFIRALPRFIDFITDPLVGYFSDNTRSRWGRRRPWMLVGLLISAVVAVGIWFPPAAQAVSAKMSWTAAALVQWKGALFFTLMMVALYTVGYAFYTIPYTGMGYEMTDNYNERTHLFKWRMMAFAVGSFIAPWLPWLCMQIEGPDQGNVLKGAQGVHLVGIGLGIVIILAGLLPILFCREKSHAPADTKDAKSGVIRQMSFLTAAKNTLTNKAFLPLLLGNLITKFGMVITGIFFRYVFYYHIASGDIRLGASYYGSYCNSINLVNLFIGMVAMAWVTDRLGKKPTLLLCMAMSFVAYGSLWFTCSTDAAAYWTIQLTATWQMVVQWPTLITGALIGLFTNTMPMIMNSMLADVCDADQLKTGQRRDAFYSGVFVSCDKMAIAVATIFQGILLVWSGFDATLSMQRPETVKLWILMLVITQPLGFLLGFVGIWFYPLTRARCAEIRAQLDARGQRP
jgi:GPH family glycoside/pentoside/hexuronide:cation symporter